MKLGSLGFGLYGSLLDLKSLGNTISDASTPFNSTYGS